MYMKQTSAHVSCILSICDFECRIFAKLSMPTCWSRQFNGLVRRWQWHKAMIVWRQWRQSLKKDKHWQQWRQSFLKGKGKGKDSIGSEGGRVLPTDKNSMGGSVLPKGKGSMGGSVLPKGKGSMGGVEPAADRQTDMSDQEAATIPSIPRANEANWVIVMPIDVSDDDSDVPMLIR